MQATEQPPLTKGSRHTAQRCRPASPTCRERPQSGYLSHPGIVARPSSSTQAQPGNRDTIGSSQLCSSDAMPRPPVPLHRCSCRSAQRCVRSVASLDSRNDQHLTALIQKALFEMHAKVAFPDLLLTKKMTFFLVVLLHWSATQPKRRKRSNGTLATMKQILLELMQARIKDCCAVYHTLCMIPHSML